MKKKINQFHCVSGSIQAIARSNMCGTIIFMCRKSVRGIPLFDTFTEAIAEFPKYIFIGKLNLNDNGLCFRKQTRVCILMS